MQSGRLIAKFYSGTFLSLCQQFAKCFGPKNFATYKYIEYILALYIYIYSMKVDYVELAPVITVGERVSVGLLFLWEGPEGLCGANV